MSRNPVSVDAGLDSFAIRTRGLSAETGCACESGRWTCVGSVPQPDSKTNASNAKKARRRATMNAAAPIVTPIVLVMLRLLACPLALLGLSLPAMAALDIGEPAPAF